MTTADNIPDIDVAAEDGPILLFDGVCNLCQSSVQFVIRHDSREHFRFASLQSDAAQALLARYDQPDHSLSSVLLVVDGQVFRRSRAALEVCRRLDQPWPWLFHVFRWVPVMLADAVYNFIGRRRYRWFGKKESCWLPDDALARRFIQ